ARAGAGGTARRIAARATTGRSRAAPRRPAWRRRASRPPERGVTMRAALLGLLGLVASTPLAGAAAPPVYPWQEAGRHVGEVVTIEGMVAAAHGTGDTCVLEFAPDDPHALRVILLVPLFSSLPAKPDRLYAQNRAVTVLGWAERQVEAACP